MRDNHEGFRVRALAQAEELVDAIATAETVIAETIERECEALRSGRTLAAKALHTRLCDAARLYLDATRAAKASIWTLDQVMPGCSRMLEERRATFSSVLKIELAILATERAVAAEREPVARNAPRAAREAPPAHGRSDMAGPVPAHPHISVVPSPRRSAG